MRTLAWITILVAGLVEVVAAENQVVTGTRLNNLVSVLLDAQSVPETGSPFTFTRLGDGWTFLTASWKGKGTARLTLDGKSLLDTALAQEGGSNASSEVTRYLTRGEHTVAVECE